MKMAELSMFLSKHVVSFIIVHMSQIIPSFISLENGKGVEKTSDDNDYEYTEDSYDYGYSVDEEELEEEETEEDVGNRIVAVTCDSCYSKVIQKDLI